MKKFYEKITARPKLIIILFVIAAAVCAVLRPFVSVNYDMNDYLPEDSSSTVSPDVTNETEFQLSGRSSVRTTQWKARLYLRLWLPKAP